MEGPIDLDALDDYLMSDHAPDDSMGLSDLAGFLTGIVVGPELILPSEWLPVIWGGQEPEFETGDEDRLGTIMGRYNEIVACLDTDPDDFDPIFLEGPEGEVIVSDRAGGFLDAEAVHPTAWKLLIESDSAGIRMAPIFLVTGDMEIEDAADENELMAQAPNTTRPALPASTGFGEAIGSRSIAEAVAGQEKAAGIFTEGQADRRSFGPPPPNSRPAQLSVVDSQGLPPLAALV